MSFAELFFLYGFLPVVLILYFISPKPTYRNAVLLVFSFLFYAWGNPPMLLLLLACSAVNWLLALGIRKCSGTRTAVHLTAVGLVLDIGVLVLFNYLGFLIGNFNHLFHLSVSVPRIAAPIGLSFYTFRVISYLLDVYWQKVEPERYFGSFLLFTSLFPCTVAGPIVRYSTIGDELHSRPALLTDVSEGISRICIGLGKKVILADNLYTVVEHYWGQTAALSAVETWFAVFVYTMYVYFDFSGYSDMAIGLGRVFGFHFEENFRYPFLCTSISEFWQRWHISLGTFFRDYLLYVPIFGKMRPVGGLLLVWFCTGLWHGASWNYVIWGLYFGLFIFLETRIGKKRMKKIPLVIRHIYTKLVIIIGFGIFYFTDLRQMGLFFRSLVGLSGQGFTSEFASIYMYNNIFLVLAALVCTFPIVPLLRSRLEKRGGGLMHAARAVSAVWCIGLLVISSILLVNATSNPFLYASF